ncbi:MAG TPA: serine/threonine-protein kinase [Urbifossiella sp.]|nr:serine/threonine-protein kinase [Urbifossiella sp.]
MPDDPRHVPPQTTVGHVAPDSVAGTADQATRPSSPRPAGPDAPPDVPGYDVVREVSRGGMGVVYEARQRSLGRSVALKLVLGDARAEGVALSRFLVESQATARVHHPHVVQVYDSGETGGRPYLVMEFCPGGTLADRLKGGRMDPAAAAGLLHQLAGGVAAAHVWGIVHRDLKPQNVLFDAAGEPKVADFGLAKFAAGATLTKPGDVMGTPAYMAPEQASGRTEGIDAAADVWALGVMLYECLTGTRPFAGYSTAAMLLAVQGAEPVPLRRLAPGVPRDLEFICHKCLRKAAADRYPSAAELAADLDRYLKGEPLSTRDRGYQLRHVTARWWKPAAVGLVGTAALVAIYLSTRPPPDAVTPDDPTATLRRQEVERRVEGVRAGRPNPDREYPHPVVAIDALAEPTNAAFRVITDDRVADLRSWKKLTPAEPGAESFVIFQNRRVLTRTAPADEYRIEYRTTGRDIIGRAVSPSPEKARVYAATQPRAVGGQAMKVRHLALDTRGVPLHEEFTAQVVATYRDSIQTPADQWLGMIGYTGALKSSILIVFPDDRPFVEYRLRVAPPGGGAPRDYDGPVIRFHGDDRRWVYWEVPAPLDQHVYRVDWTW